MFDFHEKRKIKSWIFSKPVIILLIAASSVLAHSVYELYQKERETAAKHAERSKELTNLQVHAAALEDEVSYIQSTRGIEKEIRDRFDATKKGERTVIIMDGVGSSTSATLVEAAKVEENTGKHFFSRFFFWR